MTKDRLSKRIKRPCRGHPTDLAQGTRWINRRAIMCTEAEGGAT